MPSDFLNAFDAQSKEIKRFLDTTTELTWERRVLVLVAWMGTERVKEMNDFLERNP